MTHLIRDDWDPEEVGALIEEYADAQIPADGHISSGDAYRLMIRINQFADVLGDLLAQASYYEEKTKHERNNAKALARIGAEAKTDRGKDDAAQLNKVYNNAEKRYYMASAYRKLLEEKHASAIRSHYLATRVYESEMKEKPTWGRQS